MCLPHRTSANGDREAMQLNIAAQRTVAAAGEALLTKIEESADTSSSDTLPR